MCCIGLELVHLSSRYLTSANGIHRCWLLQAIQKGIKMTEVSNLKTFECVVDFENVLHE